MTTSAHRALPGTRPRGRGLSSVPAGSKARCVRIVNAIHNTPLMSCIDSPVLLVMISRPPLGSALTATRVRLLE